MCGPPKAVTSSVAVHPAAISNAPATALTSALANGVGVWVGTASWAAVRRSRFVREALTELTQPNGVVMIISSDSDTVVSSVSGDVALRFDADEWAAFRAGAAAGSSTSPLKPSAPGTGRPVGGRDKHDPDRWLLGQGQYGDLAASNKRSTFGGASGRIRVCPVIRSRLPSGR